MNFDSTLAFSRSDGDEDVPVDIYNQTDPRGYFRVMFDLNYGLPDTASGVFRNLIRALARERGRPLKVLEIGVGFGVMPALICYPIDMSTLAHRYRDLDWSEIDSERLVALDRNFYQSWPTLLDARFVGYDTAHEAAGFAQRVGLTSHTVTSDLEAGQLSDADRAALADVDFVISLNCADFVSADALSLLIDAIGSERMWFASFALRTSPFYQLQTAIQGKGLVTEKLEGVTFVQRRFANTQEWTSVLLTLETMGLSAVGKEADGVLHTEFHIARPSADAVARPLSKLMSVNVGQNQHFGPWRRRPWGV